MTSELVLSRKLTIEVLITRKKRERGVKIYQIILIQEEYSRRRLDSNASNRTPVRECNLTRCCQRRRLRVGLGIPVEKVIIIPKSNTLGSYLYSSHAAHAHPCVQADRKFKTVEGGGE
jgi:hypothetical protein